MQSQSEYDERLDAGGALPAFQPAPTNRWLRAGSWIGVSALVGASMGVTSSLVSLIPSGASWDLLPGIAAWIVISACVGLALGLLNGVTMAVVDWGAPEYASHLSTAATMGGMIGTVTAGILGAPLTGLVVGSTAGFSAAVWVTNPTRLPLEELSPLRGRWLRIAVTGLLIALIPFVSLATFWRWPWLQR